MVPQTPSAAAPGEARGAYLGLLFVVVVWGLNFPLIKVPLEVMHPFVLNLLRFAISTSTLAALWAIDARRRGESFTGMVRARPAAVLLLGLVGHVAYQVLFILGISRTAAGSAALIMASTPVWTALIAWVTGVDRLRRLQTAGLAFSAAGVVVVVLGSGRALDFTNSAFVGNVLTLSAALAWALFTVATRPVLSSGLAPLGVTFWGVFAALPVLGVLAVPHLAETPWARVGPFEIAAIVFSGALSTGVAYALWNVAVRAVGPSRTSAFNNLVPFVALGAGYVVLREPVTPVQLLGGGLIVGGLWLVRRR